MSPKQAITLKADAEGFLMPVIDRERCIKCGLCVRKCTYLNAVKKYGRKTPKLKLCSTVVLGKLHPAEFVKRIVKE